MKNTNNVAIDSGADYTVTPRKDFAVKAVIGADSVYGKVTKLLDELDYATVIIPKRNPINIIKQLKDIARTGKLVRMAGFIDPTTKKQIVVRTIYDHILTMARNADILFPILGEGKIISKIDLAKCIVYHDICEVLLGDIPDYTNLPEHSKNHRVKAERMLSSRGSGKIKKVANNFIKLFLEKKEESILTNTEQMIYGEPNKSFKPTDLSNFFQIIDKTDPIIAVWHWVYEFQKIDHPSFDINKFTERLEDFFENQKVKDIARKCTKDKRFYRFVNKLQDISLARAYYTDPTVLRGILSSCGFPLEMARMIENDYRLAGYGKR